ncbi:hypothetical protein M6D81_04140 [Paenibacillus sp. J5C_2022]|nr:hypothetical protein [Paenibacillus sp. J5C2022]
MESGWERRLKHWLSSEAHPNIDVADKVMAAISSKNISRGRPSLWSRRSMMLAAAAAVVLIVSGFSYAAATWQLNRSDGTVSMEYRAFEAGEEPILDERESSELQQLLPAGSMALFYLTDRNRFVTLENPVAYTSYEEWRSQSGYLLPAHAAKLTADYHFLDGMVHAEPVEAQLVGLMKQLMQDAEESGESIVYREVERSRPHSASASFQANDGGVIALYASEGQNWRTVHTDMAGKEMKKVALGEQEVLLIGNAEEARYELAWMDESASEPIYYRVYTETPELVTEDELFLFAAVLSY